MGPMWPSRRSTVTNSRDGRDRQRSQAAGRAARPAAAAAAAVVVAAAAAVVAAVATAVVAAVEVAMRRRRPRSLLKIAK